MRVFTLTPPIAPSIRRVLDASTLDGRDAVTWLLDPKTDTVRKACLLNIMAVLSVTPTVEMPLITEVLRVFAVKADRIYVVIQTAARQTLEAYVADPRMPFYADPGQPEAIHFAVLDAVPELHAAQLRSFRAEGAPSLQIVIADSATAKTVADIDLDAHNPLEDVVGFVGHMWELVRGKRTGQPTDHLAMRGDLSRGPAADCLCYTLGDGV